MADDPIADLLFPSNPNDRAKLEELERRLSNLESDRADLFTLIDKSLKEIDRIQAILEEIMVLLKGLAELGGR